MPSAEETTYLIKVMQDLRLSGLKSRSSLAASQKLRASPYALPARAWPEAAAERCELCSARTAAPGCEQHRQPAHYHYYQPHHRQRPEKHRYGKPVSLDLEDSYERLQALLRNGALIKEAVKRLQSIADEEEHAAGAGAKARATSTSATSTTLDSMDEEDEDDEDVVGHFVPRRKDFDYDPEDEPIGAEA